MTTLIRKKEYTPYAFKAIDIKEVEITDRKASGYLAVFGNKDSSGDILVKGCFAKSLNERGPESTTNRKIAFLWQHNMSEPLGRFTKLLEDDYGLYFEAEIDDFDLGNRAITQLKSGTLNQFSIGYQYVWDKIEYDAILDAFVVKEVNLWEGSIVTQGANEMTYFDGFKNLNTDDHLKELSEQFIKSLSKEKQQEARLYIMNILSLKEQSLQSAMKHSIKNKSIENELKVDVDLIKKLFN